MEVQTYKAIREAYGDMLLWALDKQFKNEADEDAQLSKLLQEKFDAAGIVVRQVPIGVSEDDLKQGEYEYHQRY